MNNDIFSYPNLNGKVKLKNRHYTLSDVVDDLIHMKDRLIRYISLHRLSSLTKQSEFDLVPPFVIIKVYKTFEDQKNDSPIYLVFANHGQVPYCNGEVLESYKLDEPRYFWDFKIDQEKQLPSHFRFAETYVFSDDADALTTWIGSLNYDEIFDHFCLDGGEDLAGFAGFFWVKG